MVLHSTERAVSKKTRLDLLLVLLLSLALAACGDNPTPAPAFNLTTTTAGAAAAPTTINIDIVNFKFSPAEVSVPAGSTVIWTNKDAVKHNVIADDKSFESPTLDKGATFSKKFDTAGAISYFCSFHGAPGQGMTGKLTVTAAAAVAGQATTVAQATTAAQTTAATTTAVPQTTTIAAVTTAAVTENVPVGTGQQIGSIFFRDDLQLTDQMVINLDVVPNASAGKAFFGWLVNGSNGNSLGIGQIVAGPDGKLSRKFSDPNKGNLLGAYDKFIITSESLDPTPSAPSQTVAFGGQLPAGALVHIRHLLYSFPTTPNKIGLETGLRAQTQEMRRHAESMRDAFTANDLAGAKREAEALVNIIEGSKGPDFGDLDRDGKVTNTGDGFGLLKNGDQIGYLDGSRDHANLAAKAADATDDIKLHASHVVVTADNVGGWVSSIRDRSLNILKASELKPVEPQGREILTLANQAVNGVDLKGDGQILPVPGSGGALTSYQHAQLMAGIPVKAVEAKPAAGIATTTTVAAASTTQTATHETHTNTPVAATTTQAANTGALGGPGQEVKIDISQFKFGTGSITIKAGTKVTWTNQDSAPHTATADNSSWDSGTLQKGQSFSYVFNKAGVVKYHCEVHPNMTATINVV